MENLDQELKNYYRAMRLSPQKLAAIQASVHRGDSQRRGVSWFLPLAAGLLLAVGIGIWWSVGTHGSPTRRVVAEIVRNHRQQGPLLVESPRYDLVQAALSDLDFPIRPGRDELVQAFALLGGKYCTIQATQAAQLKLSRRGSGIIHTLYVVPRNTGIQGVEPGVYERNGVEVELWTDRLLLYALAHGQ